jgi:WD40 repeat protein
VAIANRETIWIVDTATARVTARLSHTSAAPFGGSKSLAFIDENRLLIGAQGGLLIWDLGEGLVTSKLHFPSNLQSPHAVAWSESTQTMAFSSGVWGTSVKVVPVTINGFGQLRDVHGFEGVPSDLVFSRDGRYLAASGDGEGVSVRELSTGEPAGELPTEGYVSSLQRFGQNGLLVSGKNIAIWTFFSEPEPLEFENPDLQGQINSQIATRVAGGVAIGALTVALSVPALFLGGGGFGQLFMAAGELEYRLASQPLKTSQQAWCGRSSSISPDGRWLADIYPGISKEIIGIYDMSTGELVRKLSPRGEYSCVIKFSPDGKQLLLTSTKVASLYDTETWSHRELDLGKTR